MDNNFLLYADPGAGALILQMLMAVLFGALFFLRTVRYRILSFFGKGPYAESKTEKTEPAETDTSE